MRVRTTPLSPTEHLQAMWNELPLGIRARLVHVGLGIDPVLTALADREPKALSPQPLGARCMDCGAAYKAFPLDTTLPDDQWLMIHDCEGGILCASCIVKRAGSLPGAVAVRARIEFANERRR